MLRCVAGITSLKMEQSGPAPEQNRRLIRYSFCNAPFHEPVQCEHSLILLASLITLNRSEILTRQMEISMRVYVSEGKITLL